jgi:hypothetical protein
MAKIVQPEPQTVLDKHACFLRCRSQMIGDENRRGERNTAAGPQRREQENLAEYLQGTLVDVTGKAVVESGPLDNGDLQWFTRNVLAQALTNGYCAIPIIAGPCPHPNACLNCAHFRTDISFQAMDRALAALQRMDASDQVINFRTVAAEAKVSTAWLYGQQELRARIMRSRKTTSHRVVPSASAKQDRERLSKQNIVATLRLRIETLEEKNRELTMLLELAYGKLALAREKNASESPTLTV